MWILNLLADSTTTDQTQPANPNAWVFYVLMIAVIALLALWFFFSGRKNRQYGKEHAEQLEALAPGHKVITTGGICGVVVEVCDDDTIVIETGSEQSGKSYFKLDKRGIYETDAKGPTQIAREAAEAKRKAEKEARAKGAAPAADTMSAEEPSETAEVAAESAEEPSAPAAEDLPSEAPVQSEGSENEE